MKTFRCVYNGKEIKVTNSVCHEKLYVDGRLQDHAFGFANRSLLWGCIHDSDNKMLTIKARIGGFVRITCDIFIDNKLVMYQGNSQV